MKDNKERLHKIRALRDHIKELEQEKVDLSKNIKKSKKDLENLIYGLINEELNRSDREDEWRRKIKS